jgi:hypothetical protein
MAAKEVTWGGGTVAVTLRVSGPRETEAPVWSVTVALIHGNWPEAVGVHESVEVLAEEHPLGSPV